MPLKNSCQWQDSKTQRTYPGPQHSACAGADRISAHLLQLLPDIGGCGLRTTAHSDKSDTLQRTADVMPACVMQVHNLRPKIAVATQNKSSLASGCNTFESGLGNAYARVNTVVSISAAAQVSGILGADSCSAA